MTRRLVLICLLPALALVLGGCLFEPREPETPSSGSIQYLPRASAANVWENCRLALINKDVGGWDTNVSEAFIYIPDSDTRSAFPAVDWDNWGKESEMTFISRWFATDVTIRADLLDVAISTPDGAGGVAEWDLIYLINVTDNADGSVTRYRGRAVIEFNIPATYWYVNFWRDEQGEQDPENPDATLETMGRLRGAFAP